MHAQGFIGRIQGGMLIVIHVLGDRGRNFVLAHRIEGQIFDPGGNIGNGFFLFVAGGQ